LPFGSLPTCLLLCLLFFVLDDPDVSVLEPLTLPHHLPSQFLAAFGVPFTCSLGTSQLRPCFLCRQTVLLGCSAPPAITNALPPDAIAANVAVSLSAAAPSILDLRLLTASSTSASLLCLTPLALLLSLSPGRLSTPSPLPSMFLPHLIGFQRVKMTLTPNSSLTGCFRFSFLKT
jgi:hypothetical protein